VGLYQYLGS